MLARQRRQLFALPTAHDPAQWVVQRGHAVQGAYLAALAQCVDCRQIRPVFARRKWQYFQLQRLSNCLEAGVGQGVGSNHVTRLQQAHQGDGQAVLSAADQQDLLGGHRQPAGAEMLCDDRAFVGAPGMGLVAQQGVQIACAGQVAQCAAQ